MRSMRTGSAKLNANSTMLLTVSSTVTHHLGAANQIPQMGVAERGIFLFSADLLLLLERT
jgi:hypothetical protein